MAPPVPARLRRSDHISWYAHMGAVYLFHDLYGYLLEMSPDIADLIASFGTGVETQKAIAAYKGDGDPAQFVDVLLAHSILLEPDENELDNVWPFVPLKGKWNVWQRSGDTLTLWTAWGNRPVTQIKLDADETAMWDAMDGEKRLAELRMKFAPDKLRALVQRLTHSDVQALKLSMMPWSTYAKRPGLAPRYLASTMPYASWKPGTPVPAAVELDDYHHDIASADAQFDHTETTLSHLLRVPHPALAGRTYGQALVDAVIARGLKPGKIRVLEIGAGLGYVARDAIARLQESGREVDYTIVELSSALASAQKTRVPEATWIAGDILAIDPSEHGGTFELIICNEMVGDLPAEVLSRADIGLNVDGTGEVDPVKLAERSPLVAQLGLRLDDAPEPFHLQTGAIELVTRLANWLAPGGIAFVSEFGDTTRYPTLSTHLDHPELSTHFGHLLQAARARGLEGKVEFIIDLIDVDREQKGLVTGRSQFRALRALARASGVELHKIGYTPEMFGQAMHAIELSSIGDLRWDRIEDRLMGLVPHEFRALIAHRA